MNEIMNENKKLKEKLDKISKSVCERYGISAFVSNEILNIIYE